MTQEEQYNYIRDFEIPKLSPCFEWDKDGNNWIVNEEYFHEFKDGSTLSFDIYAEAIVVGDMGDFENDPYYEIVSKTIEISNFLYNAGMDEELNCDFPELVDLLKKQIEIS